MEFVLVVVEVHLMVGPQDEDSLVGLDSSMEPKLIALSGSEGTRYHHWLEDLIA